MSEEREMINKATMNCFKELSENPKNFFDNANLQQKYNDVLKEKIDLQQENKQLQQRIDKANKFMQSFIYDNLMVRELIMINGDLKKFEDILKSKEKNDVNKYSILFKYLDFNSSGRKYIVATSKEEAIKKFKEEYKNYNVKICGIKILELNEESENENRSRNVC